MTPYRPSVRATGPATAGAEGHADAPAILGDPGRHIRQPGSAFGVWAARTGPGGVTATPVTDGREPAVVGAGAGSVR